MTVFKHKYLVYYIYIHSELIYSICSTYVALYGECCCLFSFVL